MKHVAYSCLLTLYCTCAMAGLRPERLTCDYAINPLGIDVQHPLLGWIDVSENESARGQKQSAYEIIVGSSASNLTSGRFLWSTRKVGSDDTLFVPYAGPKMATDERIYWKVRVWDQSGNASPWSAAATWTTGIMKPTDWTAKWITCPDYAVGGAGATVSSSPLATDSLLLRREFRAASGLRRAIVDVCGLGQYEMTVNGVDVTANLLTPGWTKYDRTCLYDTYDITALLRPGKNAVGLFLGNGMYNSHGGRYYKFVGSFGPQEAICQLTLTYDDGSHKTIGSDSSWTTAPGPITFSSIYGGEDFDARLVQAGWDKPGFDDRSWLAASIAAGPGGALRGLSHAAPPIVITQTVAPKSLTVLSPTRDVYDLGQNAAYMPKITVSGPKGASITVTPAELLNPDGTVDRESVGGGEAYWKYTLAGTGAEVYFPKFFYQGCRYLQIDLSTLEGAPLPKITSFVGEVVGSSSRPVGSFTCSNDQFNRTYTLIRWAQRSNLMSVITDCPARERLGWLEESHLNGPALRYNFDLDQLMNKVEGDMADSQTDDGLIPDIAPEYTVFGGGFRDSPEWGSAFLLIPLQQFQISGDTSLLTSNYAAMKRYVDYLTSKATNNLVNYGLGDWYDIGPGPPGYSQLTPPEVTATAFYYQDAMVVASVAEKLKLAADVARYAGLAANIRTAFIQQFWSQTSGSISTGSETANAVAYVMGLTPDNEKPVVLKSIVDDIESRGMSFTSGDVGYRYLLLALADGRLSDLIYKINNQDTRPGYGYQLRMGATSLTEAWDARRAASQDHFMLGQINEWFFHDVGGIQYDPNEPGFKNIVIRPTPAGDLTSATTSYDSVRGLIETRWSLRSGKFSLFVDIPANTTAEIYVPTMNPKDVTESGTLASASLGVKFSRMEDSCAVYTVGSGIYHFRSDYARLSACANITY